MLVRPVPLSLPPPMPARGGLEPAGMGLPHTMVASAAVLLHGDVWDAFTTMRVLVPWAAVERVVGVSFEVHIPPAFCGEASFDNRGTDVQSDDS